MTVVTPGGVNGANALYTYLGPAANPAFQMSFQAPVSLQVVQNESLVTQGIAVILANQHGTLQATTTTPWLTLTQEFGSLGSALNITANAAGLAAGIRESSP